MRDFSLERLDQLFSQRKQHRYTFWRHDVDFSLDAALKMALFEQERCISSTYYLFFDENWPFYSYRDAFDAQFLILDLGHRVGKHIDERKTPQFELFMRGPVSFHCPTPNVLWRDFSGIESAYASYWKGHYYSDSGGKFRYGDPEDDDLRTLQVNLHPEYWFEPDWLDKVTDDEYRRCFYVEKPVR